MRAVLMSSSALAFAVTGLISGSVAAQGPNARAAVEPSAIRAVPAETTVAALTDPNWEVPRTSWGDPSFEGVWSTDDMRGVGTSRNPRYGTRESLTPEEFAERASRDEGGRDRAINTETFLRNEWGIRTFGYTSLVIDPPDGRIPEMTEAGRA